MILLHKNDLSAPTIRLIYRSKSSLRASPPGRSGCGKGKGGKACNYVSGIWISASKSRCEMLIGGDDISNDVITSARVFQCLFTFALVSSSRWLAEIWQLSRRGATRNWRWNSNSRDVVASSPSFSRSAARAPHRACSQAKTNRKTQILLPEYCSFPISAYMTVNRSNVRFVIGCASP